jgi:enoyl-CoA hydratase
MTYETLLVEQRGAVTLVTLNRPQALNALNSGVLEDLIAAFAAFEADDSQRCAVLTGSGDKAFAAGADIKEMADKPAADFYLEDFFSKWTISSSRLRKRNSASPKSSSASPRAWAGRSG